jgi:hypothetical protein
MWRNNESFVERVQELPFRSIHTVNNATKHYWDLSPSGLDQIRHSRARHLKACEPTPHLGWAGRGAGLVGGTAGLADLTPVKAAEARAAEGDPRPVYTWAGPPGTKMSLVRSYTPSHGGAPRLIAAANSRVSLGVWDTGTGAFLGDKARSRTAVYSTSSPTSGPRMAAPESPRAREEAS